MLPRSPLALLAVAASALATYDVKKVVSGYYPDYNAELLPAANVNYDLFNHIDYFVAVQESASPSAPLVVANETNMKTMIKIAHKRDITVSISIGGWTGSRFFSDQVATAGGRSALATNYAAFMKKYDFDGIDLDWEYPFRQGLGCNALRPEDTANYLLFLQILRSKIGNKKILSAAVSVQVFNGPDGNPIKDTSGFAKVFDHITIMAYDIIGPGYYNPNFFTGPNAPLYDTCLPDIAKISGSSSVATWEASGFPASKILLGIPAYGYGYSTLSSDLVSTKFQSNGKSYSTLFLQNATSTPPPAGPTGGSGGDLDQCGKVNPPGTTWLYRELVDGKKLSSDKGTKGSSGYVRYFDTCSGTPFLFNKQTKHFISYDDAQSFHGKGAFVKKNKLAGINVFDMNGDTKSGVLLKAVRSAMQ